MTTRLPEVGVEVWVVDDDPSMRWVLERALSRGGMVARTFGDAGSVLDALREGGEPGVLVTDIRMPGISGITLLEQVRQWRSGLPVIIMTAHSDLDSAVSAFRSGAFEYLPKPFDLDQALELIRRALGERTPPAESEPPDDMPDPGGDILGQAPAMQDVFRAIGRLAQSNVTVLITGESGTGKELIAHALHRHNARSGKPFVALNMAAIPRDLLESELFGHERGSFTGAQHLRRGRFEQASGGTLFLDEIGDMPPEMQTRLLRVLSDGQYFRVGGHEPIHSDVRIVAATHQDLEERVRQGLFREDLFHRLNVIRLRLPPLRERVEDIPILAKHFLHVAAAQLGGDAKRLSREAVDVLQRFAWPGNVRQLENVCNWLTVMAPTQVVAARDLPPDVTGPLPAHGLSAADLDRIGHRSAPMPVESGHVGPGHPALAGQHDGGASDRIERDRDGLPVVPAWQTLLEREVERLLLRTDHDVASGEVRTASGSKDDPDNPDSGSEAGRHDDGGVMSRLMHDFEASVIAAALRQTQGRRVEAAARLGIGRNTITRKIQELGLEGRPARQSGQ